MTHKENLRPHPPPIFSFDEKEKEKNVMCVFSLREGVNKNKTSTFQQKFLDPPPPARHQKTVLADTFTRYRCF